MASLGEPHENSCTSLKFFHYERFLRYRKKYKGHTPPSLNISSGEAFCVCSSLIACGPMYLKSAFNISFLMNPTIKNKI